MSATSAHIIVSLSVRLSLMVVHSLPPCGYDFVGERSIAAGTYSTVAPSRITITAEQSAG
jgi:hypothetical protein